MKNVRVNWVPRRPVSLENGVWIVNKQKTRIDCGQVWSRLTCGVLLLFTNFKILRWFVFYTPPQRRRRVEN